MIAILIVTHNAMLWIKKSWDSFTAYDEEVKVIVIDNDSKDGTIEIIKKRYPHFLLIESDKNMGFGKANNIAISEALKNGCEHFLLLNQDATLSMESIKELAKLQKLHPEYGILSPLQLFNDSKLDRLHLKSLMNNAMAYFNDLVCTNPLAAIYNIKYTNAAIWMVSKECLRRVGGFDPLFPHYGEDVEYANRATYCGMRLGLTPNVKGYHFRDQNQDRNIYSSAYYYNTFLIKAKDCSRPLVYQLIRILSELGRSTIGRIFGLHGLANVKSWSGFFRVLFEVRSIAYNRNRITKESYLFLEYEE